MAGTAPWHGPGADREPKRDPTTSAVKYSEPRWPSYFKRPSSVEGLTPAARALARKTSGIARGMGILQAGDHVPLQLTASADPMVLEAIKARSSAQDHAAHQVHLRVVGGRRSR